MREKIDRWYALYVKSRHEFTTQGELNRKGIANYLPSIKKLRHWKDRDKYVDLPLFPGYIFVKIMPKADDYMKVLKTRGAVNLLANTPGNPTPVSDDEIESLRILIESGENIDVYPHLKEGDRIRVKRGPLKGAEGYLEKKEDQYIFAVHIELLGRSIGVKLYGDDLEEA